MRTRLTGFPRQREGVRKVIEVPFPPQTVNYQLSIIYLLNPLPRLVEERQRQFSICSLNLS